MRRVHVLGDLNLDLILSGLSELPVMGREILAGAHRFKAGGSAANVAVVLALCGASVRLFACLGRDAEGELALRDLRRQGLATRTITRLPGGSTAVTVSLTYPRDRIYVTAPGALASTGLSWFKKGYLRRGAHLHLSSFFLQRELAASVPGLLAAARRAGMTTSLDPGHDPAGLWQLGGLEAALPALDWLLPNAEEARALAGTDCLDAALGILAERLRRPGGMVVKAGADGAWLWQGGQAVHFPALPISVVDTTCAGDCFDAGFLLGLCRGLSPPQAVAVGNRFGALGASCLGLPSREAVHDLLRKRSSAAEHWQR
jgi:sugar/nucleoside kinase (ribokinase family)